MSKFNEWLRRNDIGLGSIVAFAVVPFVAAVIAAVDKLGVAWWTLTPDQLWTIIKAAAYSVAIGLVGRYGQAIAQKWGAAASVGNDELAFAPGDGVELDPPALDVAAGDIGDADPVDLIGNPISHQEGQ